MRCMHDHRALCPSPPTPTTQPSPPNPCIPSRFVPFPYRPSSSPHHCVSIHLQARVHTQGNPSKPSLPSVCNPYICNPRNNPRWDPSRASLLPALRRSSSSPSSCMVAAFTAFSPCKLSPPCHSSSLYHPHATILHRPKQLCSSTSVEPLCHAHHPGLLL